LDEPTITVRVNGVVAEVPLKVSGRPAGADVKLRSTVLGYNATLVAPTAPVESFAESWSSRYEG
jgi:hypothetical protein